MVFEIFSRCSMLTVVASEIKGWGAYQPVDVILNDDGDMSKTANKDKVKSMVHDEAGFGSHHPAMWAMVCMAMHLPCLGRVG